MNLITVCAWLIPVLAVVVVILGALKVSSDQFVAISLRWLCGLSVVALVGFFLVCKLEEWLEQKGLHRPQDPPQ